MATQGTLLAPSYLLYFLCIYNIPLWNNKGFLLLCPNIAMKHISYVSEGYQQQGAAQHIIHPFTGTDSGSGVHTRQHHRHVPGLYALLALPKSEKK